MHEMRKAEAVQQHHHRHVDGRKEVYGMHKFNDNKSSSSSTSIRTERDNRATKTHAIASQIPGAIRICGDWSEHLSSNGKVYFFNNKTKSSQWERPKDWSSSRAVEVKKDKAKPSGIHNKVSSKHSTDGSSTTSCSNAHHAALKQQKSYTDPKKLQLQQQNASRIRTNESQGSKDRDYRTTNSSAAKDRDYRDIDYRDARLSNNVDSRSQDRDYRSSGSMQHNSKPSLQRQSSSQVVRSSSTHSIKDYNGKNVSLSNDVHYSRSDSRTDHKDNLNIDGTSREDRPRSSNSTPRSINETTKREWPSDKKELNDGESSNANGSNDSMTPSSLVQTLSSVLNQAGASTSEENKESSIEGHLKNALQMLLKSVAAKNSQITGTTEEESPPPVTLTTEEEEPPAKRVRSSNPTDEHINNSSLVSQSVDKVLNDLRGILDERHTLHVQGWPADQLERQSNRLCDENHQFVVNHTSQLSASMKMARSQVRSAEIHSTLQEQRVLYIRQQITDLEKSTTVAPFT